MVERTAVASAARASSRSGRVHAVQRLQGARSPVTARVSSEARTAVLAALTFADAITTAMEGLEGSVTICRAHRRQVGSRSASTRTRRSVPAIIRGQHWGWREPWCRVYFSVFLGRSDLAQMHTTSCAACTLHVQEPTVRRGRMLIAVVHRNDPFMCIVKRRNTLRSDANVERPLSFCRRL